MKMTGSLDRRSFMLSLATAAPMLRMRQGEKLPPVRALTRGPKFHWFGYYDKLQFDPTGRYVLGNEVDFEHRSPRPDDVIRIGMVDLQEGDRWIELDESRAWNWQQGCMLQWVPGSKNEIIWNDRDGDRFVSHILNVETRQKRTLPAPIYTLSPDGRTAIAPDFRRLNDCRPGYGYAGISDPNRGSRTPETAGIWRMDLQSGKQKLLITFAQAAKFPFQDKSRPVHNDPQKAKHWFNHLLYAPDGKRFLFLHRWRVFEGPDRQQTFSTRMFTADPDGRDLYIVDPYGGTSHFIWRDPRHICAWAWHPSHGSKFYLYEDKTDKVAVVGPDVMTVNGHNTYLPGRSNEWILNDTYPDKDRLQHPYLYHIPSNRRIPLGHFHSPPEYVGEWRCDLHPRYSPDGTKVIIDSTHEGIGRQMYLIDISAASRYTSLAPFRFRTDNAIPRRRQAS
jgi:hypothetical protein